jgi:hypothetical protein
VVVWRKNNKLAIRLCAKVKPEVELDKEVHAAFLLKFHYVNSVYVPATSKNGGDADQPCAVPLKVRVYLKLGRKN